MHSKFVTLVSLTFGLLQGDHPPGKVVEKLWKMCYCLRFEDCGCRTYGRCVNKLVRNKVLYSYCERWGRVTEFGGDSMVASILFTADMHCARNIISRYQTCKTLCAVFSVDDDEIRNWRQLN